MSDRMPGKIVIGGSLKACDVEQLCAVICASDAQIGDWSGDLFLPTTADELLANLEDGRLVLYDVVAAWGEFPAIEEAAIALELPFDCYSDGKYEYMAQLRQYRPGLGDRILPTTPDHAPVVGTYDLRSVLELLAAAEEKAGDLDYVHAVECMLIANTKLREVLPAEWPDVPVLEIVSDVQESAPPSVPPSVPVLYTGIDWAKLQLQKRWLIDATDGLVHLIDAIQDTAVDVYGIPADVVFPGLLIDVDSHDTE
jgi:hypothetical protein